MRTLIGLLTLVSCQDAATDAPSPLEADAEHQMLYPDSTRLWTEPIISVCWETPGFTGDKAIVEAKLTGDDSWSASSNVRFVGWGNCVGDDDPGIHITAGSSMVVFGGLGERDDGTSRMELDFTAAPQDLWARCEGSSRSACIAGVSLHEFGHSLGFAHEHNRQDTPESCSSVNEPQGSNGDTELGSWDADSIMNYCNTRTDLSRTDQLGVERAYGSAFPGFDACSEAAPCAPQRGDCDGDNECSAGALCLHDVGDLYGWPANADVCVSYSDYPLYPGSNHCTPADPCPSGLGGCDGEGDCVAGASCLEDVGPLYGWPDDADVCITPGDLPYPGSDYCTIADPCPSQVGDCDSDLECRIGTGCVEDVGDFFGWSVGVDVCITPGDLPYPGNSYCTIADPCPAHVGDCDSDLECRSGTICVHDIGGDYGWASSVDVCQVPSIGGWQDCNPANKCPQNMGDCDTDFDCQGNLVCEQDVGAQYGWDPALDVCVDLTPDLEWVWDDVGFCIDCSDTVPPDPNDCSCLVPLCSGIGSPVGDDCDTQDAECWHKPGAHSPFNRFVCRPP